MVKLSVYSGVGTDAAEPGARDPRCIRVGASEALTGGGVCAAVPMCGRGGENPDPSGFFGSRSGNVLPSSSMLHRGGESSREREFAANANALESAKKGEPILRDSWSIYCTPIRHKTANAGWECILRCSWVA